MRLIAFSSEEPGAIELQYLWLPAWMGINTVLKQEVEEHLKPFLVGKESTDVVLDEANDELLDFLSKKYPHIEGLRDYLDSLKFVRTV